MMSRQSHHRLRRYPLASVPVAVAALALVAWALPATAADSKAYPGSACVAWGTSTDIQANLYSEVRNISTTNERVVVCPIVRDNTTNINGTRAAWVYVYRDASATSSVFCNLYSANRADGTMAFSASDSTSVVGNDRLEISLNGSAQAGPYTLNCTLPPLSKIYSYIVPEY